MKIISAALYGVISLFITFSLKAILSIYKFPSIIFIGLCQMICIFVLSAFIRLVQPQTLEFSVVKCIKIFPLPVFYFTDILMGLGGTMELSLPMFTVLRRISNVMLLIAEILILKTQWTYNSLISVFLMILGSIIAATNDLSFSSLGYTYVFVNNLSTTAGGICLKLKQTKSLFSDSEYVFYNAAISFVPMFILALYFGEFDKVCHFDGWNDRGCIGIFMLCCILGPLLRYTTVLCTKHNGPLTTSIIGVCKNIVVTYVGMSFAGDYIFSWFNFLGLNISALGAVLYISKIFTINESSLPQFQNIQK